MTDLASIRQQAAGALSRAALVALDARKAEAEAWAQVEAHPSEAGWYAMEATAASTAAQAAEEKMMRLKEILIRALEAEKTRGV